MGLVDHDHVPVELEQLLADLGEGLQRRRRDDHARGSQQLRAVGVVEAGGVQVDEDLILNLIDDAIKYTPSGGKVSLSWEMAGDVVELWVKDTGVGTSPEHVPHIKDRFYQSTMRAIAPRAASG